jgi:hypothetical protein
MGILAWFKRVLGIKPKGGAGDLVSELLARGRRPAMTASEVLLKVLELQQVRAQWPDIWQALNPDGDPETQRLLEELRGPHMFVPHAGLNVLEEACRRVLVHDSSADRSAALQAAVRGDDPFVRPE